MHLAVFKQLQSGSSAFRRFLLRSWGLRKKRIGTLFALASMASGDGAAGSQTQTCAWIPYAWLNANDTHWQRIPFDFSGPTPELGNSFNNVQIEALLRYQFQNGFSVGIGGRYWRIDTSSAQAHFKSRLLGAEFHRPSHS